MKSETRKCQNCKNEFIIEPDDFGFYEKIKVPPPTFCPECRLQRRLMWRNERTFYQRQCDLCKKNIISSFTREQPFPVYCQKCWWGDDWDPYSFGIDFDFSKSFFEQFQTLKKKVPILNMQNDDGIASLNSEYSQDFAFSKNCYLTSAGWYCDNVMYSYYTCYDKDIADSFVINNSERCYECFESNRLFDSKYSRLCFDSMNLSFCYDLRNCQNCFMCTDLRGKNYYIRNRPYTREAYLEEIQKENLNKRENLTKCQTELEQMILKFPHRFSQIIKSPLSTGNVLVNSKMSKDCFWSGPLENCRYMIFIDGAKDSYDINNSGNPNLCYESVTPDNSYNGLFTIYCWKCSFSLYSYNCHSSNNILGCIGIKHGEYSIFNKKYSAREYEDLKNKIIEHMKSTGEYGEFFPSYVSPYCYNETLNMDFSPLNKNQAKKQSFNWRKEKERNYQITCKKGNVPSDINKTEEDILNQVIECAHQGTCEHKCSTAFKLIEREFQIYKKMNIPVPIFCPNCRYYERIMKRNPPKLWHRQCTCLAESSLKAGVQNSTVHFHGTKHCPNEFETSYAPERSEIIYCEECYNREVY